jgi:hypothetical protein
MIDPSILGLGASSFVDIGSDESADSFDDPLSETGVATSAADDVISEAEG